MYKAIIFDFFDVIHTDPLGLWMRKHRLQREGEVHEASVALDSGQIDVTEFCRRLAKVTGQTPAEVKHDLDEARELNEPLVALIRLLGQHYKVALLSNAGSKYIRGLLDKHQLETLFHEITISSEVGKIKPSPEAFHHVLTKLGVSAAESIFIDDNLKNVAAARALGIQSLPYTDLPTLAAELRALGIPVPPTA